jgi:signal transduction histidine kinase
MQKRILSLVIPSILIILASLGLISYLRVHDSIKRSYEERIATANMIARYVDHVLESNLTRLYDISLSDKINLKDNNWGPERQALRDAYEYSIFTDGLFLLDREGNVLLRYPHREGTASLRNVPFVSTFISKMKPVISSVYTMEPTQRKVIFILVPLKDRDGEVVGAAGGEINPTNYSFTRMITAIPAKENTTIELVDDHGVIIASNKPRRTFTSTDHNKFFATLIAEKRNSIGMCHHCHEQEGGQEKTRDVLAFAPLFRAPWGVAIREPEVIVFSPATQLKKGFFMLGLVSLAAAFILAIGMSRSIVKPLQVLTKAARNIGAGNLSQPIEITTKDEIGTLARSFDDMRVKLAESLASIQLYSVGLEQRVYERTKQLEEKQNANKVLLKKVISSQEDERKRIARELHDETLQALSALLMGIEMCGLHPDQITREKVSAMSDIVTRMINEMNNLVQNLRPTVLDDLGFDASIAWILDRNLKNEGINCSLTMDDFSGWSFTPEVQITLFRIVQEASMNVARHSEAQNVFVHLKRYGRQFMMSIEDDGIGFDTASALKNTPTGRGLGILGMKERAALLNGNMTVCSAPEAGTLLLLRIPLDEVEV